MKRIIIGAWIIAVFVFPGCNSRKVEKELERKRVELNQKEQQLLLREKTLSLQEEELQKRKQLLDSISQRDSLSQHDTAAFANKPEFIGTWMVRMTCIETSCPGSAIGDTKTEQWNLSYQNNYVIVEAMAGNKLVRVYSGQSTGNTLELIEHRDAAQEYDTKMTVRLHIRDKKNMDGQREIIREKGCKILYSLQMEKQ